MIALLLWDSLWQGALIAAIAYFGARLVSDRNPATRYALWFTALLAMIALPLATQFSHLGAALVHWLFHGGDKNVRVTITLRELTNLSSDVAITRPLLGTLIGIMWVSGFAIQLARFCVSLARVTALRRGATPMPALGDDVMTSDVLQMPIAAGFLRPRVILPHTLASSLSPGDLEAIVEHERAHILRGDIYGNLIQRSIETFLWFNPFAHLAGHYLVRERESACDDWAIRNRAASEYVACLADLATRTVRPTPLLTPSALGSDSTLLNRIRRLMRGGPVQLAINYYALGGIVITFSILALGIQALTPIASSAAPISREMHNVQVVAAASCLNQDARVITPVEPDAPRNSMPGTVDLVVKLDSKGTVTSVTIQDATKNLPKDEVMSVIKAAQNSTYAPATHDCVPVSGTYIFHAQFATP